MHTNLTQGDLRITGNPLDVALEGRGFFAVQTADGVAYTRQGTLSLNPEGVVRKDGKRLDPALFFTVASTPKPAAAVEADSSAKQH